MLKTRNRRRLALLSSATGVALMGVDLMLTRSVFVHVGELMLASLACFALAIAIDRQPDTSSQQTGPQGKALK